jgi:hypothetical protein
MGNTHHDPIDDFRTTHLHTGESIIDVYRRPGLFPVAVGVIALIAMPIRRITFVYQLSAPATRSRWTGPSWCWCC